MPIKALGIGVLVADILILNAIAGWFIFSNTSDEPTDIQQQQQILQVPASEISVCDESCRSELADEIKNSVLSSLSISPTTTPKVVPTTITKTTSVYYYPVPGSGETLATTWSDLSGTDFYLDKSDYAGYVSSVIEVNARLKNGNGQAYIRLYDVTNKRAVDGSEVSTGSQTSTVLVSNAMSLWEGKNQYRIQAKSLTADTTIYEAGRIKITVSR